ncbi:ATP-grasp domain-containing protein [Legionella waltersii]|uniref:Phosphoribosylglycinamide synthetase ATP-grasp (A) domain protein n=1 Tax=Legionella waltersii TaxID=66969 RepID=A0A0W1ADL0_9GAMM|nr:ATP-grasp domain-containing protein [Legionella waltersii]KTD79425.1 phosphoribosylglycinamide synthetase ATP-grasp (A) domain protein [Legionella waltersii]SNU97721.1 phosphoribosylglycinamide synthetase ATP-grasp (A) domain protein [Legionella waltersii]
MTKSILFVNLSDESNLIKINTAKKLGHRIFLVAPELPYWAAPQIDKFIQADTTKFSDTLDKLHKECKYDPFHGVITILDKSVELVATIAEEFNLPGSSLIAATTVKHKYKMREALQKNQVAHPKFLFVKTLEDLQIAADYIGYPMIFKPVAASTSVAVFKLNNKEELEQKFQAMIQCQRTPFWLYPDEYIAEEFMQGQEVSAEGIINQGKIHFAGITSKFVDSPGFTEWMQCFPASLSLEQNQQVFNVVEKAIHAVGIDDCAFHVEVMITADGPKIVEINSRMAGSFIASHLVPLASGIDLVKLSIQTALGEPIEMMPSKLKFACERNLYAKENGTIADWLNTEGILDLAGVKEFKVLRAVREYVSVPPEGYNNLLCAVVTEAESFDSAIELARDALHNVRCIMTGVSV